MKNSASYYKVFKRAKTMLVANLTDFNNSTKLKHFLDSFMTLFSLSQEFMI